MLISFNRITHVVVYIYVNCTLYTNVIVLHINNSVKEAL